MAPHIADILRVARSLIATPEQWTQGVYSRVGLTNIAYCPLGACQKAARGSAITEIHAVSYLTRAARTPDTLWQWNDKPRRTHAQVLAAFDRAIALAEKEASK